jgi:hypothetical protein
MYTRIHFFIAVIVSGVVFHPSFVRAQGSLTPPGAPAPTMKTLAQIEARTPIASAPFTIASSGSYYLTTNLTVSAGNAITINANNVRLDLNGFTISSTENPATLGCGILLGGNGAVTNITIVNGFIQSGVTNNNVGIFSGSGLGYGISGAFAICTRVSGVSVSGCLVNGIELGVGNSVVESCTVNTAGTYGIVAQSVFDSTAVNCETCAVYAATANNCSGMSPTAGGIGIYAFIANNCVGNTTGGIGVSASTANNCYGYDTGDGEGMVSEIAIGCISSSISGKGLSANIANSCYSYPDDANIANKYNMP